MSKLKWSDQSYGQLIYEKRQTLIDNDMLEGISATKAAEDLLLRAPGLGDYVRHKRKYFNSVDSVARDILNGIRFDKWHT